MMDPSHLKSDELLYEYNLRQIDSNQPQSLNRLAEILNAENNGERDQIYQDEKRITRMTVTREIKECEAKFGEIMKDLNAAIQMADDGLSEQGQTRLVHIGLRVARLRAFAPDHAAVVRLCDRIQSVGKQIQIARDSLGAGEQGAEAMPPRQADDGDTERSPRYVGGVRPKTRRDTGDNEVISPRTSPPNQAQPNQDRWLPNPMAREFPRPSADGVAGQQGNLQQLPTKPMGSMMSLFDDLLREPQQKLAPTVNNFFQDPAVLRSLPHSRPQPNVQHHQQSPQYSTFAQQANGGMAGGHRIHQWPLRFEGGTQGLDADDFVFRVERQAQLNGVSTQALVIGIGNLLTGRANQWYWTYQRRYPQATWEEFKAAFIGRYAPHKDTDFEMMAKIEKRRQRFGESFNNFCQDIEAFAVRLRRPLPEDELVAVLRRNMAIYLRKALWREEVESVDRLLQACSEYEQLCQEEEQVAIAKRPMRVHELKNEPPPAQVPYHELYATHETTEEPTNAYISALGADANKDNLTICWNCKEMGHSFVQCGLPQQRAFCFSCGLSGVIKAQCPRCSENSRRGVTQAGAARPPLVVQPQRSSNPRREPENQFNH